ncbi:hypothetical protein A3D81_03240 [Candidatus Curtissbacteria bacterium RIFCSPHIGHO2_02_FULL_40_17]|uniref:Uncharacterized protein n=3 Tax=Candidatus Curtissiibacteriota TaxID=1752717 RepID=A0A1F5GJN9_9BACT|nr:MAG: hypothetical protein A3D81_03240 [Candidatus Curtissbacteria bacterium RIFCSPHIGHO2_02_FULL_40_17]OGE05010.1 MAG: hypothetical protein A3F45_02200 [Candidatus Curtissbacteria bacterium RIFCSPHIGHO2_12_FULL_41_17]OGE07359.1 MAG: hypothetical protein A3I53_02075 [Candidatus Curtissbacteria bacterium RIFCSPLOWO2_02_FULL_40_13b]
MAEQLFRPPAKARHLSSVGRVLASKASCHGFESRLPLNHKGPLGRNVPMAGICMFWEFLDILFKF